MLGDSSASLIEGRLRRHPEGGARCGVLRRRLATAAPGGRDPARQALRPGREELAITEPPAEAQAEVDDGDGSAGPGEPKTATVERREACVPRHGKLQADGALCNLI